VTAGAVRCGAWLGALLKFFVIVEVNLEKLGGKRAERIRGGRNSHLLGHPLQIVEHRVFGAALTKDAINTIAVQTNPLSLYPFGQPLLTIGGSVSISAPTTGTVSDNFNISHLEVGGSLSVTGDPLEADQVTVSDTLIYGAANFKGLGGGAMLNLVQDPGADARQMLITGNLSVDLAGGNNTFKITDPNPGFMILGTTTIAELPGSKDSLPPSSGTYFAFAPKIKS
jgi:hypothetical protein